MNAQRWFIPVLVVAALIAGGATAAAVAGGGDPAPVTSSGGIEDAAGGGQDIAALCVEGAEDCNDMIDCTLGENDARCSEGGDAVPPPVTSGDGIDPDECNLVHNIDACTEADCERLQMDAESCEGLLHPEGDGSDGVPVTSGDGIDPDECSLVQNVDACDAPGNE